MSEAATPDGDPSASAMATEARRRIFLSRTIDELLYPVRVLADAATHCHNTEQEKLLARSVVMICFKLVFDHETASDIIGVREGEQCSP